MLPFLGIVVGTFASEDLTCIATGLLIQRGEVGVIAGVLACTTGIFVGDLGLWLLGRIFGQAAIAWPWTARGLRTRRVDEIRAWLERHAAGAIVASRFLPGTRFALYVVAGVLRLPAAVFAVWALVGAMLWTPTIVLLTATLGEAFIGRVAPVVGVGWPARIAVAAIALGSIRAARALASPHARMRIAARIARWRRWEFWPMWLFYLPLALWIAWLAIRHRGLATITAANPGMPDGGLVGESKFDILQRLPPTATIPAVRLEPGDALERVGQLRAMAHARGWTLPLVLKPDVGERGLGVRLVRDWHTAESYLAAIGEHVIAQPYHAGPFEAGVFYYRLPSSPRGRIFSITDKVFPTIVGDGLSTLETLIWTHPRYRLQATTFAARHRDRLGHVLDEGETFPLALAGNHCQGTMFRDGGHLVTPGLERRIDAIAQSYPGFFVGRFDIRYSDVNAFMRGEDVAIVELNGVTAESTNIYDPAGSLLRAYRTLFRQWAIIFAIGSANRRAGAPTSSLARLLSLAGAHARRQFACALAD
ncbi:MAG TPA: DedA family protein [Vicinamibacterales bacterium]|nr:DedA family protein [Vicinamibacterales bacterium]